DKVRKASNKKIEATYLSLLSKVKKGALKDMKKVHSAIDKAAKKGVIHANKAARLKSQVTKLLKPKIKSSK
ncbi:MAG: 30S ribosomal protein S20, partial [Microgenomates group bacterium]